MNKIQVIDNVDDLKLSGTEIVIDLNDINKVDDFIQIIYQGLGCPDDFGLNLNAFFDTIKDTQFWVKKPLTIIIKNFKGVYDKEINLKMLLSDIFIDIIAIKGQIYYIYILE